MILIFGDLIFLKFSSRILNSYFNLRPVLDVEFPFNFLNLMLLN